MSRGSLHAAAAYRESAARVRALAKAETPRGNYPQAQAARMVADRFDELADELLELAIEEEKQALPVLDAQPDPAKKGSP